MFSRRYGGFIPPVNRQFGFVLALTPALLVGVGVFWTQLATEVKLALRGAMSVPSAQAEQIEKAALTARFHQGQGLPLTFEPNEGQSDSPVKFLARGRGYRICLNSTGAEVLLTKTPAMLLGSKRTEQRGQRRDHGGGRSLLRIKMEGGQPHPLISAIDPVPGTSNYLVGKDPTRWRTNIPHFLRVRYQNIYPAIDLIHHGSKQGQLEFDFVVRPGARPDTIRLTFQGADRIKLNSAGDLSVHLDGSELVAHRPAIYQQIPGVLRRNVSGKYLVMGKSEVRFQISAYDESKPLVIDPILSYSTYIGGSKADSGLAIAVDHAGNTYIAGDTGGELPGGGSPITRSSKENFPTTKGAFQTDPGGGDADAFVTKLNSKGSAAAASAGAGAQMARANDNTKLIFRFSLVIARGPPTASFFLL